MIILVLWLLIGLIGWSLRLIQTPEIGFGAEDAAMLPVCMVLGPIALGFVLSDVI